MSTELLVATTPRHTAISHHGVSRAGVELDDPPWLSGMPACPHAETSKGDVHADEDNHHKFRFVSSYYQRCHGRPVLCRFRLGKNV